MTETTLAVERGIMLIGVDIGGTFTDLVMSQNGALKIFKLPSTPQNPAEGMLDGLREISGGKMKEIKRIVHGSTVATNAILERKGARTALITTKGFRDVLFIGRQNRPDLYALHPKLPPPLIPRDLCFEVEERLDHWGNVLTPLDIYQLNHMLDDIARKDVEAVAVCLLYSYVNPEHERIIRSRIVERAILEEWQVALSCEVLPEFREYERTSTVALEAYVRPVIGNYVTQLHESLSKDNDRISLSIMKSDGGVISTQRVREQAIQTALSGPAAGVIGAHYIAQLAGYNDIITFDMGGTSTDVAIVPGEPIRRPQSEIDGLPLRIRLLDIETIGAGGGSIARVDSGGVLRVGPESAGAVPGPVVYGRGGTEPTVSDANAILGLLDADHFLGGRMQLELTEAEKTVKQIGKEIDRNTQDAARGIIDVANANIDRALRSVSIARGYDPRLFTLVTFGGAGALHACAVAHNLQIPRVLIPRYPGVMCAFGLLVADVMLEYSQSILHTVDNETFTMIAELLEDMLTVARDDLKAEGIPRNHRHFITSLDVRYHGQAHELNIPMSGDVSIRDTFHEAHERTYGHRLPKRQVEIVNLRVQAIGTVTRPPLEPIDPVNNPSPDAAYLGEKSTAKHEHLKLFDREKLQPGMKIDGAALIFQMDSTLYVADGWVATVDHYYNLLIEMA